MMKIKKILAALLVAVMAVSLAACQTKTMSEDESVVESESIVESESVVESESTPAEDEVVEPVESESAAEPAFEINMDTIVYDEYGEYGMTVDETGAIHYSRSADNVYDMLITLGEELPADGELTVVPDDGVEAEIVENAFGIKMNTPRTGHINLTPTVSATGNFTLVMSDINGTEVASWYVIIDG